MKMSVKSRPAEGETEIFQHYLELFLTWPNYYNVSSTTWRRILGQGSALNNIGKSPF